MINSVRGTRGMAVAPHALAAQSALAVLREGGNAIEAMIAAAACIAVVYPHMNSIGGDSFWLLSVPGKAPGESSIYAISTICPHQGCQFEFETDYREVSGKIGKALEHPVLFCHCHMSTYDPTDDGRVIHGPAPRPPFRFDFREEGETLVITGLIGTAREN